MNGRWVLAIAPDAGPVWVIDTDVVDIGALQPVLTGRTWVVHDAVPILSFLAQHGAWPGEVHDTMVMATLVSAGTDESVALADCVRRYLPGLYQHVNEKGGRDIRTPQGVNDLVESTKVLMPLFAQLCSMVDTAGLATVARIESCCIPTVTWMGLCGVGIDTERWKDIAAGGAWDNLAHRRLALTGCGM